MHIHITVFTEICKRQNFRDVFNRQSARQNSLYPHHKFWRALSLAAEHTSDLNLWHHRPMKTAKNKLSNWFDEQILLTITSINTPSDLSQSSDDGTTNTLSLLFFSVCIITNPAVGSSTCKIYRYIYICNINLYDKPLGIPILLIQYIPLNSN